MLYFSLPFSNEILTVEGNSTKSAVSFVNFDGDIQFQFDGEIKIAKIDATTLEEISTEHLINFSDQHSIINEKLYLDKVKKVIDFIKENHLEKLVFSRRKMISFDTINLLESFENLRQNYPNAFSYIFVKEENCWIGAFSEVLGKYNKKSEVFETMSIAGTLPLSETWSEKEIGEQKTVTDYLLAILQRYSKNIHQSKTGDHFSGNIKHLKTEFSLKIEEKYVENLIAELHPTPAVCGIPKEFCKNAIKSFENTGRELYSGYVKIETMDFLYYFVNLRCAKIYKNNAVLFVGGGITKDSDPDKEWRETELKAEAIEKNLVIF